MERCHVLTHEVDRYSWDVIGVAEAWWNGEGETSTEEGHNIWHSGEQEHGIHSAERDGRLCDKLHTKQQQDDIRQNSSET